MIGLEIRNTNSTVQLDQKAAKIVPVSINLYVQHELRLRM